VLNLRCRFGAFVGEGNCSKGVARRVQAGCSVDGKLAYAVCVPDAAEGYYASTAIARETAHYVASHRHEEAHLLRALYPTIQAPINVQIN
jgi:hypothetical protein